MVTTRYSRDYLQRFEHLLADLSARFVNVQSAQLDGAITDALRQMVLFLDVDRSQLIRFSPGSGEASITHSWAVDGVPAVAPKSITDAYPWALGRERAGHAVPFRRIDELPPEAAIDKASWQRAGTRSHLGIPMRVSGRVEGAIAFACLRGERDWPEDLVERIGDLADVFANALAHKRAQDALNAALGFEQTVSDLLAALLAAGSAELDRVIETGLRDMAEAFGAERATLWRHAGDKGNFTRTHQWLAEGAPAPPDSVDAFAIRWINGQLAAGSVVRFARRSDLPPEAAADRATMQALNVGAAVIVPLAGSGTLAGALSFAIAREDFEWPDALVPRAKLVGDVFATVLARQEAERCEQQAQAQAAHAARVGTMGAFAASLVHELTQPIAASLANAETAAELLAAASPELDELRATVSDIVSDGRRAGELIQRLRRFLRRGEAERTELGLREIVAEVLRLAGNAAADKGIAVTLDIPEGLPRFVADRVQIQQVMLNLLLNAFDAVAANEPDSRRVTVLARPFGSGVSVEVVDSGRGIDEPTLARIFEPFFTTKPSGMGLGLSISRTIVAAHGGELTVRSTPGHGTAFRFEMPLRTPGAAQPAKRAAALLAGSGTVFVIDDDPSMRRALDRQLRGAGYRVEAFASARDYLDHVPQARSACIVSDVRMPGLSGLELQASLARAERDLPIVFISGHGDVSITAQAMRAGAVNFLAKPFTKSDLLAAVAEALARGRELDAARRERAELQARFDSLTPREREVLELVAAGLLNKIIADRLGAAEATVKIHRGRVMEKMGAESVADLVRMWQRLGMEPAPILSPDIKSRNAGAIP